MAAAAPKTGPDPIGRIRTICLGYPEATEQSFGGHTAPAFPVRQNMIQQRCFSGPEKAGQDGYRKQIRALRCHPLMIMIFVKGAKGGVKEPRGRESDVVPKFS